MLDIFRILDKVIHMKISQIFKSNFKHLQRLRIAFYKVDEKGNSKAHV
ncbi:MAG: hypothetical protein SPJ69_02320 [Campylobacter sp.]|nr:hypothetical protein [Campylobacter sp.]MDD7599684.1 hypothetical protein [Campylobacteraceae bacterium]MDY5887135.1 hypothetical protein [Campylobacter sp.]